MFNQLEVLEVSAYEFSYSKTKFDHFPSYLYVYFVFFCNLLNYLSEIGILVLIEPVLVQCRKYIIMIKIGQHRHRID